MSLKRIRYNSTPTVTQSTQVFGQKIKRLVSVPKPPLAIRRLQLEFPTLFGIMLINFAVIQIVPGGPVEQMIAQMTGTAVESTARFSGGGEGELNSSFEI